MRVPSSLSAVAVPAACFLAGYVLHYLHTRKPSSSGFQLSPTLACLTQHKSPITKTSTWINLGLWTSNDLTYPAACEQLALCLGRAVKLGPKDIVLDVGCGRGDQCILWHTYFNVAEVLGVDITPEHVAGAVQMVQSLGLSDRIRIALGSATSLASHVDSIAAVTKIVSCDAAYHFVTRATFLAEAFAILAPGGVLGMIDVVVADEVLTWTGLQHVQLRGLLSMTGVPFENLKTVTQYESDWLNAGFVNVHVEPLDQVLEGFAQFVQRQRIQLEQWGLHEGFEKFVVVGEFLAVCAQNNYIQFVLATGGKP
ncbi:hypothetical protein H310_04108 [Aphanomyces invadans]|uniref:phosphoethanolamine N-methyltransferase n=1 Tax=Aphanomyces invadans TaxID=157072 RepID=A0A024UFV5_9STRA|nr:hypothetical protein H310_04108 [Aphanomyces invadans]ETW05080.1 hypothetical protein H310_04108 [Aphanomyces invadans]RHY30921.1 hypothetical protein DYB32_003924 [Aphanomyces invadans]|eukprot:XP_008866518.1 hypothetical protein H310_04108 [Aphanomyces invadans]